MGAIAKMWLRICFVLAAACLVVLTSGGAFGGDELRCGGLTSFPQPLTGVNLLRNPDFSETDPVTGQPVGWSMGPAFFASPPDASLVYRDGKRFAGAQNAIQRLFLAPGTYRIGGKIQTSLQIPPKGIESVRFYMPGVAATPGIKGETSWADSGREFVTVEEAKEYDFRIEAYNKPDGEARFGQVYVRRDVYPLDVFVMYPNYRGMLFDDKPQRMKFSVTVDPPSGDVSEYRVRVSIVEDESGVSFYDHEVGATTNFVHEMDCSGMDTGKRYALKVRLLRTADGQSVYDYPDYEIVKVPGASRKNMVVCADEHNRFLVHDTPTFFLGTYDAGMGYVASERQWASQLNEKRRLFDLPVNLYVNYWYGEASLESMRTLMNVLHRNGIYYLQTGNAFASHYKPDKFKIDTDPDYLSAISEHPGLAGFYTADEPHGTLAPVMFDQARRLKAAKADGLVFGALLYPREVRYWRNVFDTLAMDPYPIVGKRPTGGFPLRQVADWTRVVREAVMDSRPVMTVLQVFQQTSVSTWPTRDELRDMSYMAIAEGANGLLYWSLGVKALATTGGEGGWNPVRVARFEDLAAVMRELKGLEPALCAPDSPDALAAWDSTDAIHVRVKRAGGASYIIASNVSGETRKVSFTCANPVGEVAVYGENRAIAGNANAFTDVFAPSEAHVYIISDSGTGN